MVDEDTIDENDVVINPLQTIKSLEKNRPRRQVEIDLRK